MIDTIIGTNFNEALMYIPPGSSPLENFGGRLSEAVVEKIFGDFPEEIPLLEQMDRVGTGIQYLCPSLALASALDKAGARAWVYRFDRARPGFEPIGAYHGAELPYMFNQHDDWLPTTEVDRRLTREMVAHWSAFVRRGDPNSGTAPLWPQWRAGNSQMIRYGDTTTHGTHPDLAFCEDLRAQYLSADNQ